VRFETWVAARYLRSKRRNRFVSLITVISVAGVSVGVTALIVVISVMTGFDIALTDAIIGNRAHLNVYERAGRQVEDPEKMIAQIRAAAPEVTGAGPIIEVEALLKRGRVTTGCLILGVDMDLEQDVTQIRDNLTMKDGRKFGRGELPGDKEIVLGFRLASQIGARLGSEIAVLTNKAAITPFGMRAGNQVWLTVSGISQAKMSEFDQIYGFVNLATAQMLTGKEGVDAIHLKLTDPGLADRAAARIENELGCRTETWYENQQAFFEALRQEKLAMFIILFFIVLVAAFNITSTLIMIVMEKRRDIGILRTLGVSRLSILLLFILEGLMIGIGGTFLGLIAGIILALNVNPVAEFLAGLFNVDLFNSTIYYFDGIPAAIIPADIFWITFSAVVLTFLSTLYPAWSAARVNPVDALRYE
jgi:lipoprotein-releasing system permease protein